MNGAAVDANTQIQYFGGKSLFFNEGAATRMTLNSTGLGIGGSPNYKLNVTGPATSFAGSPSLALYDTTVGSPGSRNWLIGNVAANNYGELVFCVSSAAGGAPTNVKMTLDASGNLGIGVTPSSWWTGFKAIESANGVALLGQTNVPFAHLSTNAYAGVPNWLYKVSNFALRYGQDGTTGNHQWLTAPSGTAGASAAVTSGQSYTVSVLGGSTLAQWQAFFSALAVLPTVGQVITATATGSIVGGGTVTQNITFTQAMTLDVSGNLLVGTATLSPTINGAGAITAKGVAGITLQTVSAILTDYTLPIGSFSGILTIRSNGGGGSAVFMLDPNAGAVSISNNIVGRTITFTFSGGSWKMQQTVGVVPSTYNYLVLANQ